MNWIGLTGGIGTGKTTVAEIIQTFGLAVIDADQLSQSILQNLEKQVLSTFGQTYLDQYGKPDRKKIASLVFNDSKKRKQLEDLIYPALAVRVEKEKTRLKKEGHTFSFYDVPLLFEANLNNQFNKIINVHCPLKLQWKRLKNRDHLTDQEILSRLNAQLSNSLKNRFSHYIIANISDKKTLEAQVKAMLNWLKKTHHAQV